MIRRPPPLAALALLTATAALSPAPVFTQNAAGTTGAVVLDLAPAPRPLALGGAYAALGADELSLFYNPARLAAAAPAVGLSVQTLPLDAGTGSLAAAGRLGPGAIGLGVQYLTFGEIEVVEPDPAGDGRPGIPTGQRAEGGEVALGAGYGIALGDHLQLGAAVKVLRLQLAEAEATGTAVDVGAAIDLFGGRATVAGAAQNLGGEIGPGRPAPLPRRIRGGVALRFGDAVGPRASVAFETIARDGRVDVVSGVEAGIGVAERFALIGRVGYQGAQRDGAAAPVVVGAGLAIERITLDYAFRALGPLGAAHLFGVSVQLDH